VCVGLLGVYLLAAIDAELPLVAGIMTGCIFLTRPHVVLVSFLFAVEALRVSCQNALPTEGTFPVRVRETWARLDAAALAKRYALFAVPVLVAIGAASWMNATRFHNPSPTAFGHEHLGVAWAARMQKWGLFGYHYLSKNLGVMLTILPWPRAPGLDHGGTAPFQINEHGLALWFTTPIYLWLIRPKKTGWLYFVVAISAALPALYDLFYQNSGWRQFGYRFSNDYSPFLFVLLALGGRPFRWLFGIAAAWGLAWNAFGAATFDRGGAYDRFYYRDGSQTILYQPD
jgi:hypothetical protein